MWCKVQQCRGPAGERLRRDQWSKPVEGDLTIGLAKSGWVAHLDRKDADRERQVLFPLVDVRVQTFEDGILVIGFAIVAETPTREVRQAWYCVPIPGPSGAKPGA